MSKRNIPITQRDHSVLDTEFSSIRERFDAEMGKMEDEMTRFRTELISREAPGGGQHSITSSFPSMLTQHNSFSSTTTQSSNTSNSSNLANKPTHITPSANMPAAGVPSVRSDALTTSSGNWLESLDSPLIQQEGDQKQLKLRFDVSQYKPEEIVVKTVDNKLLVHAKHEEKSDSRSVYREYNREFLLPQGSNPEMIKSSLSKDGVLTVEAPLPGIECGQQRIPITHK